MPSMAGMESLMSKDLGILNLVALLFLSCSFHLRHRMVLSNLTSFFFNVISSAVTPIYVLAVYLGVTMLSQHAFHSGVILWREKEKGIFGDSEASLLKKSLKGHVIRFAF